jgi:hypothetical protein
VEHLGSRRLSRPGSQLRSSKDRSEGGMERMIFISNNEAARQRQQQLLAAAERYRLVRIARRAKQGRRTAGAPTAHGVLSARTKTPSTTSETPWDRHFAKPSDRFEPIDLPAMNSNRRPPPYPGREEGVEPCGFARRSAGRPALAADNSRRSCLRDVAAVGGRKRPRPYARLHSSLKEMLSKNAVPSATSHPSNSGPRRVELAGLLASTARSLRRRRKCRC